MEACSGPQLPAARWREHSLFLSLSPSKVSPKRRLMGSMELLFSESGGIRWPELLPLRLSRLGLELIISSSSSSSRETDLWFTKESPICFLWLIPSQGTRV